MKRSPIKRRTPLKRAVNGPRKTKRKKSVGIKLEGEFSRLIRARDKTCVFSGITSKRCGGNLQCSHILPKGSYPLLRLHPKNAVASCYTHHIFHWHKNPWEAKEQLLGIIGPEWAEELEWLRLNSLTFKNYTEAEWRQVWEDYGLTD